MGRLTLAPIDMPERWSALEVENARLLGENRRLRAALKPFAAAVYNDNGDMTVTPCGHIDYAKAYFVMRDLER